LGTQQMRLYISSRRCSRDSEMTIPVACSVTCETLEFLGLEKLLVIKLHVTRLGMEAWLYEIKQANQNEKEKLSSPLYRSTHTHTHTHTYKNIKKCVRVRWTLLFSLKGNLHRVWTELSLLKLTQLMFVWKFNHLSALG
jgi:hypothetical protein